MTKEDFEKQIIAEHGLAIGRGKAAEIMGISIAGFDRYRADHTIKTYKLGQKVMMTPAAIVEALKLGA